jgi:hypothetical protein
MSKIASKILKTIQRAPATKWQATRVRTNDAAFTGAAKQRSGSSTGCVAVGVLQPTDDALDFCFTDGNDGFTWTYN